MPNNIQQKIIEARKQGISDDDIVKYLEDNNLMQELETQAIQQAGERARGFLEKTTGQQLISPEFRREIPGAISETLIKGPAKFGVSIAEIPEILIKGQATQREYQLPLVGKLKSFQTEFQERIPKDTTVINSLSNLLLSTGEVGLAGLEATGLGHGAAGLLRGVGRAIKSTGKALFGTAFDLSAREAQLVQSYKAKVPFLEKIKLALRGETSLYDKPITLGETGIRTPGILGTQTGIGVRAKRAGEKIFKEIVQPQLDANKTPVKLKEFFNDAEDVIIRENKEISRRKSLIEALDSLREDYKGIESVSLSELQKIKEGFAKLTPEKFYRGKPITGALTEVKALAADEIRTKIYNILGKEVKQAYFDYGNLKGIAEVGQKAMTEGRFKGGAGSFLTAVYDTAITPVKTIGGKIIYKTGEGIEFIGKYGAKNVGNLFKDLLK